jgi:16S rRNA (guanine527-N7)-methyltransferase
MPDFIRWTTGKIAKKNQNSLKNGILYLKGGDLTEELSTVKQAVKMYNLNEFFTEEFFETKKVVYVRL